MVRKAFIPPMLPPKIDYTALIKEIGHAHDELGRLNGLLINIPNADLLIAPLLTKEAVLSSRIEGTQATIEDVLKYEAEQKISQRDEKEKDIREIINYRRAIHTAIEELKHRPIGENLIKKVHYVLLDSVRGADKDRGNLRRTQVYIGLPGSPVEEAIYIPPPTTELLSLLSNWEIYVNSEEERDPLVQIGAAHYQFEAIHPFMDGNGRIGRLLIPLFLYQRKLLTYPLLYISECFEKHKRDYYDLLNEVSKKGKWEGWIRFFLLALTTQSLRTQNIILKMLDLYNNLKNKIMAVNSVYAINLLDIIFESPIISFASVKKRLKTKSYQTIYNLLAKFTKAGILEEIPGRKRNKIYVFKQLLEILR
ncbi:MAG: Fic family protein [Desulfurellaceae bacterium]|nr:Fic family protein [Desulfurellaceae bacterium]